MGGVNEDFIFPIFHGVGFFFNLISASFKSFAKKGKKSLKICKDFKMLWISIGWMINQQN